MVLALDGHQAVVALSEGGVDFAGVIGGDEQRFTKAGVTGLGRPAGNRCVSGVVSSRDETGEGSDAGEVAESAGVAESSEDLWCADDADAGSGPHDAGRVGGAVDRCDAFVHCMDLFAQTEGESRFSRDVGGQFIEVELVAPQRDRGLCGGQDLAGAFAGPGASAGAMQKVSQSALSQVTDGVRVGVTGQEPEGCLGHVRAQRSNPCGPHQFQQAVEALHRSGASMDQPGPDLDRPLQRISGANPGLDRHSFRVQQRQSSEHLGVEAVALGVLVEVVAQVSGLLGWNHHHDRTVATEPRRQRNPRVARRFHDHCHLDIVGREFRPEVVEFVRVGSEPMTGPQEPSRVVCA